jgi:hypothetical protein
MNLLDLTPAQLKRAASIKEQIEALNKQLLSLIVGSPSVGAASSKKRTMSVAVKKQIAATQKARWAKLRRAKSAARPAKPTAKTAPKALSAATRAKLSAKLKAYWAAKKAGKK